MSNILNNKEQEKNKKIIIIASSIVALIIIASIICAIIANSKNKGNNIDIPFTEQGVTETYVDDEGREITKVTDENGEVKEYYLNDEGYLVTRETEAMVPNTEASEQVQDSENTEVSQNSNSQASQNTPDPENVKVLEDYDDADGNHVHTIILPDGTVIIETTTPDGNVSQEVKVPESPLTSYISYGDTSKTEELKIPETTKLDYSKIVGYAPMYSSKEDSNVVFGIELPYPIGDTGMVIESIGSYIGPYVEDGSDREVENVAALVVTNTGNQMIQYSNISFDVKRGDGFNFVITNLPAKTSIIVFESNGAFFEGNEVLTFGDERTAYCDRNMHESEVTISAQDNLISLTNNSDKKIDTAYVYYKLYLDCGVFYGGITYRVKIEDVEPEKTITQGASHYFVKSSEVISVDFAYAE